jgi:RNA-dependent RNA polymerase
MYYLLNQPWTSVVHSGAVLACSTFTDGAGVCGNGIAKQAARALGFLTGINSSPSAIQIRFGGCKGVLSVHPHLKENDLRVRPSMEKFKSDNGQVNVVRVGTTTR